MALGNVDVVHFFERVAVKEENLASVLSFLKRSTRHEQPVIGTETAVRPKEIKVELNTIL